MMMVSVSLRTSHFFFLTDPLFKLYSRIVCIIQTAYTRTDVNTLQTDLALYSVYGMGTLPTYCCLKILLRLGHPVRILEGLFR
jgi:hypothetical protein